MLKNIVLLSFKEDASTEQLEAINKALTELQTKISEILRISFGADKGLVKNNADFAITTEFDSDVDFQAYLAHPAHQELVGKLVVPVMASMQATQFQA